MIKLYHIDFFLAKLPSIFCFIPSAIDDYILLCFKIEYCVACTFVFSSTNNYLETLNHHVHVFLLQICLWVGGLDFEPNFGSICWISCWWMEMFKGRGSEV